MTQLANILTLSRLLLAPLFVVLFLVNATWAALGALILAIYFEITDMLDGYVARNIGCVSSIGKLIDPLADSVARFSIFLAFTTESTVREHFWPVLLVALIFYRDAVVAYIRIFAASGGVVLAARTSGKIKAVVQGVGIIVFLSVRSAHFLYPDAVGAELRGMFFYVVMIPIVIVTLFSGMDYVRSSQPAIAAMMNADREGRSREEGQQNSERSGDAGQN